MSQSSRVANGDADDADDEVDDGNYPHAQPNPWRIEYPPYDPTEWQFLPDCTSTANVETGNDVQSVWLLSECTRPAKRPYEDFAEGEERRAQEIGTDFLLSQESNSTAKKTDISRPPDKKRLCGDKSLLVEDYASHQSLVGNHRPPNTPTRSRVGADSLLTPPSTGSSTGLKTSHSELPYPHKSSEYTANRSYSALIEAMQQSAKDFPVVSNQRNQLSPSPTQTIRSLDNDTRRAKTRPNKSIIGQSACFNPLSFFDGLRTNSAAQKGATADAMDLSS